MVIMFGMLKYYILSNVPQGYAYIFFELKNMTILYVEEYGPQPSLCAMHSNIR